MTEEQKRMLERINRYAAKKQAKQGIQAEKKIYQPNEIKPILQELANEKGKSIEDIFVEYMDLTMEAEKSSDGKMQNTVKNINKTSNGTFPFVIK